MRNQSHRDDALLGAPHNRLVADRKGLEERRMRPLVGLGHDENLPDVAVDDLARRPVLRGPFMRRPGRAGFVRIRVFVVVALERKGLIAPRQLEDLENLLEHLAIGFVDL
jgi:hypothetical protein